MSDDADELAPQASEQDFDTEPIVVPVTAAAERVTLPWLQPPPPRRRRPARAWIVGGATAVVVVVAVAVVAWYVWRPGGSTADETDSAAAVSEQVEDDPSAAQALVDLVAPRHPSGACAPVSTESEAVAVVVVRCSDDGANAPSAATYSQAESPAELRALFDELVGDLRVVTCPGNIQSPGPWRRAGSTTPAGTLVWGTRGQVPTVAWTTDGDDLLSVVSTDAGPRSLEMLYTWWSQNS